MQYKLCCHKIFCDSVCLHVCIYKCGSTQQSYLVTCNSYKSKTAASNVLILNLNKPYKSHILPEHTSASRSGTPPTSAKHSLPHKSWNPSQETHITNTQIWRHLAPALFLPHHKPSPVSHSCISKATMNPKTLTLTLTLTQAHQYISPTESVVDWGYMICAYLKLNPLDS